MPRTLLVTNDFPPRVGGIQSYLADFLSLIDATETLVLASTFDSVHDAQFDQSVPYCVIRWGSKIMLPTPQLAREVARLVREEEIDTVWFGAAAPLAVLGAVAKRAGARQVIATTHGHEVGWSMLPGARQVLRQIGRSADVVTYVSRYTRSRFEHAFGAHPRWLHLPAGVDVQAFSPASEQERDAVRKTLGMEADEQLVVCISRLVPRKGQDQLIRAFPEVLKHHPRAKLVIVGEGRYRGTLQVLARGLGDRVLFSGRVSAEEKVRILSAADIFAMPARTRGRGLDVEGLGIVYLEAQACGIPVVAGDSGGAPETVTTETGIVVPGNDQAELTQALIKLLDDPELRRRMGKAGRENVEKHWSWEVMGARLRGILTKKVQ